MIYRKHDISLNGKTVDILANGKKLETVGSVDEAISRIDQRWAAFPKKPLGWW